MKTIVTMGRGGTGKTSFVALVTKCLIEIGETPLLLVDADPDQNLGEMVDVDLEKEGKKTISELLVQVLKEGGTTVGIAPSQRVESKIWAEGLYEGSFFDLIAIGTKWIEGCYCMPNAALKGALNVLTKTYKIVIIDSPAGLEHLNRRITPEVNDIFDLLDLSKKAFGHIVRARRIIKEIGIKYNNMYIIGGCRFSDDLKDEAEKATGLEYLGTIAYDKSVADYILRGFSLLDLPPDSPAYLSVKKIMEKAGYIKQ